VGFLAQGRDRGDPLPGQIRSAGGGKPVGSGSVSTMVPWGVDCERLGGGKLIGGGRLAAVSSVEGGNPVGGWTRGHQRCSLSQGGTTEVGVARGSVGSVRGQQKTTDNGGCSWKKTVASAVASLGGLASDSGPRLEVK
jgi:hypothetical protein